MNNTDKEYNRLLNLVFEKGKRKKNRTGTDTFGVFGAQARFDLQEGFPLLTTKKVWFKGVAIELLWFLAGDTNIKYLVDNDVHIWDDNCYDKYLKKKGQKWIQHNGEPFSKEWFIAAIKSNDPAALKEADLGEGTYGGMWRNFPAHISMGEHFMYESVAVDQIQKLIDKLKSNPDDRRLIVSAWHPYWVDNCALPPCHALFQFHTEELEDWERSMMVEGNIIPSQKLDEHGFGWSRERPRKFYTHEELDELNIPRRRLNCQLYQRSCDLFLGIPFNIAAYSLLTCMIAHVTNMIPGEFIHTYGDLHLYENHLDQAKEQLARAPRQLPKLLLNPEIKDIFSFSYGDIKIEGYDPHPAIKADMAV